MTNLKITTLQTNLVWENIEANLTQLGNKLDTFINTSDIIILPEMFTTGFSMNPAKLAELPNGKTLTWLKKQAQKTNAVITGSYIVQENGYYYNRLVWMPPNGVFQTYDKKHLFSLSAEPAHYTSGKERLIVTYKGWKICPLICFDLRFPVWSRNTENYDLLIYVANWPEKRAHHWRSLLMARAIENQVYTIGVNRVGLDGHQAYHSGDTSVIDYNGGIIVHTAHIETSNTVELDYQQQQDFRQKLQFLADRDDFQLM